VRALGIQEVVAARQSPWQNIYVERVIGTIRSECTNHVIVVNEGHLRRVLSSYVRYYNECRTHKSLDMIAPKPGQLTLRQPARRSSRSPTSAGYTIAISGARRRRLMAPSATR
jgi:transposase InsO family protein